MALADYSEYKNAQALAMLSASKSAVTISVGRAMSFWTIGNNAGAVPGAGGAVSNATAGVPLGSEALSVATWIKMVKGNRGGNGGTMVCDRLVQMSGLSGTVTTEQTTNLPTAALTRYTSGVGVFAAVEIYTAVGGTITTVSMRYTNQAGTANRTSPLVEFGGTSAAGRARATTWLPLEVGDIGVRSVEGVTLTATSGTAGDFGITLFRPILPIPAQTINQYTEFDAVRDMSACLQSVEANACLWFMECADSGGTMNLELQLIRQP